MYLMNRSNGQFNSNANDKFKFQDFRNVEALEKISKIKKPSLKLIKPGL